MTSNPMTQEKIYDGYELTSEPMTVAGAVNKTMLLLAVMCLVAIYTWNLVFTGFMDKAVILLWGGIIAALIFAIVMRFKPQHAKILSLGYAVCEGLAIGVISAMYETQFQGIVMNAAALTITTMFGMLLLYKLNILRATETFKKVIMAATMGIMIFYLISIVTSLLGAQFMSPFFSGPLGIGISLVIVTVAALNFILDFDFIEKGVQRNAPKYFEWFGAFSLLVTLVWLYIEMLRLLSLLRRN